MTEKEKEARRKRRDSEIAARIDDTSRGVIIKFDKGSHLIDVEIRDDATFHEIRDNDRWKEVSFCVTSELPALAEFIRALSARYNAAVDEMNSHVTKTKALKAARAPE